jgi:hypothetical protein
MRNGNLFGAARPGEPCSPGSVARPPLWMIATPTCLGACPCSCPCGQSSRNRNGLATFFLRRERNSPYPGERLPQAGNHHQVGVKPDACEAARAERCQPVLVFQPAELALYGGADTVQPADHRRPASSALLAATPARFERRALRQRTRLPGAGPPAARSRIAAVWPTSGRSHSSTGSRAASA